MRGRNAAGPAGVAVVGVVDNVLLLASLCLEVVSHLLEEDDVVEVELAVGEDETSATQRKQGQEAITARPTRHDTHSTGPGAYSEERGTTSLTTVSYSSSHSLAPALKTSGKGRVTKCTRRQEEAEEEEEKEEWGRYLLMTTKSVVR